VSYPVILEDVSLKNYIRNISISFEEGNIHCIVGPNGSGKTTLLRLITGLIKPSSGSISVLGRDPFRYRGRYGRSLAAALEPQPLPKSVSVLEYLKHISRLYGLDFEDILSFSREIGLDKYFGIYLEHLSSGNIKKVLLTQSICINPDILILDEPTMHLDLTTRGKILNHLLKLSEGGTTIIVSSHEFNDMEKIADKVHFIYDGRMIKSAFLSDLAEEYGVAFVKEDLEDIDGKIFVSRFGEYHKLVGLRDDLERLDVDVKIASLADIYEYTLYRGVSYEDI